MERHRAGSRRASPIRPAAARGADPGARRAVRRAGRAGRGDRPRHHRADAGGEGDASPRMGTLRGAARGRALRHGVSRSSTPSSRPRAARWRPRGRSITGAAGAIGSGICAGAARAGLPRRRDRSAGPPLDALAADLESRASRTARSACRSTSPSAPSVAEAFRGHRADLGRRRSGDRQCRHRACLAARRRWTSRPSAGSSA